MDEQTQKEVLKRLDALAEKSPEAWGALTEQVQLVGLVGTVLCMVVLITVAVAMTIVARQFRRHEGDPFVHSLVAVTSFFAVLTSMLVLGIESLPRLLAPDLHLLQSIF